MKTLWKVAKKLQYITVHPKKYKKKFVLSRDLVSLSFTHIIQGYFNPEAYGKKNHWNLTRMTI